MKRNAWLSCITDRYAGEKQRVVERGDRDTEPLIEVAVS